MKVLVIGSQGNVGHALVKHLKNTGHNVTECDWHPGYRPNYYQADITMPLDLLKVYDCVKPDVVYHLAAMVSRVTCEAAPSLAVTTNLVGVQNVAELCKKFQAKMIYFSTSEVYGNQPEELVEETTIPQPNNRYGLTKYLGEKLVEYEVKNHGLKAVTVRPFMFYHEDETHGDHRSAMIRFIEHLSKKEKIDVHLGSERAWLHLDDAVNALEALMHIDEYRIFNIGHSEYVKTEQVAELIAKELGVKLEDYANFIQLPEKMTLIKRPNTTLMETLLGVTPQISLEQGIKRVIAKFKQDQSFPDVK
ncbi:NAD-dependent epimerase/dehydratase family protein [Marinibactrum halimedae]|uniref:Epimerase n=1 Tax=Marinibactrum halimedae TaxID=1444977 RepID=A0AA37TA25_9GAMM|nr:NAD(P)-dependent oxidoreductase [Marinibactrum halimedae]MCD9458031.1 NAD(P)-dependent oxidoreductase [Marinibactrum halimedae]GLS27658.1 epimerase [Marinibactrum halimedae]